MANEKVWKEICFHHYELTLNGEKVALVKQWDKENKSGLEFTFDASFGKVRFCHHKLTATSLEEAKKEVERILLAGYSEFVAELKKEVEKYNKLVQVLYAREATKESSGEDDAE